MHSHGCQCVRAHQSMYIPQEDHMHAIDFHIFANDLNNMYGHRVIAQSLGVIEAVMNMFSHDDNSTV